MGVLSTKRRCLLPLVLVSVAALLSSANGLGFNFSKSRDRRKSCLVGCPSISGGVAPFLEKNRRNDVLISWNQPTLLSTGVNRKGSVLPLPPFVLRFANLDENLVQSTSVVLRRISWFSWWAQVILSTVSAVTLMFAKAVISANSGSQRAAAGTFFLSGTGITLSAVSIFWTWGQGARLSRRLLREGTSPVTAATMLRRAVAVGSSLNLLGMLITIVGAEQIVGTLAAKVLTAQGVSPFGGFGAATAVAVAAQTVQPLDILIVQGNTNTLLSHFMSLACTLYLGRWVDKLDPPSVEDNS